MSLKSLLIKNPSKSRHSFFGCFSDWKPLSCFSQTTQKTHAQIQSAAFRKKKRDSATEKDKTWGLFPREENQQHHIPLSSHTASSRRYFIPVSHDWYTTQTCAPAFDINVFRGFVFSQAQTTKGIVERRKRKGKSQQQQRKKRNTRMWESENEDLLTATDLLLKSVPPVAGSFSLFFRRRDDDCEIYRLSVVDPCISERSCCLKHSYQLPGERKMSRQVREEERKEKLVAESRVPGKEESIDTKDGERDRDRDCTQGIDGHLACNNGKIYSHLTLTSANWMPTCLPWSSS